ncbi:SRPBCC family protein [Thermocrispum municipale]|uniref:SRPBCC family protein n=1 Tax=Thermocrispum municipale TaxID=37926 RepID=UPI0003FE108F|nr:SRPBCC family protein [Thermocrispum municipale]
MSSRVRLSVEMPVAAPVPQVWAAVTDWPRQSQWILGTTVEVVEGDGRSVGSRVHAYTGRRPIGFLDTMVITAWEPPHRVEVMHDGKLIRGPGVIEVQQAGNGSVLRWSEDLEQPFGAVGRFGWRAVSPLVRAGFRRSLATLARSVERQWQRGESD